MKPAEELSRMSEAGLQKQIEQTLEAIERHMENRAKSGNKNALYEVYGPVIQRAPRKQIIDALKEAGYEVKYRNDRVSTGFHISW